MNCRALWIGAATLCSWGHASTAHGTEYGVGLGVRADGDQIRNKDTDTFQRPGPHMQVPVRWDLGSGVYVRSVLGLGVNGGQDRVEWERLDGFLRVYSDDHWTLLSSADLLVGPELLLVQTSSIRALWGVDGGLQIAHERRSQKKIWSVNPLVHPPHAR